VPALRGLAAAFPDHRRVLAAPAWLAPLALHTGTVAEVADTAELAPLAPRLHGADVAVNLHGRGPESTAVLAATGPARLVAFGLPGSARWDDGEHERHRWCRLLESAGIDADPADVLLPRPDVAVPPHAVGATLLHPGASTAARRWPATRWAEVAVAERDAGRGVLVTGSRRRSASPGGGGAGPAGRRRRARGRHGSARAPALAADAGRVVSGDTGVAHVATAMGTPSVVLFGPTSPAAWGPPHGPLHRALCRADRRSARARARRRQLRITADDVVAALAAVPDVRGTASRSRPVGGGPLR
jgi:ADP-heptose:LPS heptosyltransferase